MAPLMEVRRKGKELTASQAGETLGPRTELLLGLYFSKEKNRIVDKKKDVSRRFDIFRILALKQTAGGAS